MITVLHVIDTGGPGGAETVFLKTCLRLDARQFRSIPVVSRDGWLAQQLRSGGIEPRIVSARGSLNVSYLRKLLGIVRQERVDVIAAHLYGSAIYCNLAGLLGGRPVVAILHGQTDIQKSDRFSSFKRLLVRRSSAIVFVSEKLRADLAARLGAAPGKCRVIANGVDPAEFDSRKDDTLRRELGLQPGDILVGAVGNIREPKGYDVFLLAAQRLRQRSARYRFVIAGEGGNALHERLLQQRRDLGLDEVVTFLGLRKDAPRILRNLDIFVLSSTTEGFSLACVEAMSSGVPVVATRSGGPEEIVEDGVSGLLVPVRDPGALAAAITSLTDHPAQARALTECALQRVKDRFTISTMLRSYEQLFQGLVDRSHRSDGG